MSTIKAEVIGVAVFIIVLIGINVLISLTSTRAVFTFFTAAILAAYIADQADDVD